MKIKKIGFKWIFLGITVAAAVYPAASMKIDSAIEPDAKQSIIINKEDEFLFSGLSAREEKFTTFSAYWMSEQYSNENSKIISIIEKTPTSDLPDEDKRLSVATQKAPPRLIEHFIGLDGEMGRYEEISTLGWDGSPPKFVVIYDGELFYRWNIGSPVASTYQDESPLGQTGAVQFQVSLGPNPYRLSDELKSKRAHVIGRENIGGFDTLKVRADNGGSVETWWIAPNLDSLILRYEITPSKTRQQVALSAWRYIVITDVASKINGVVVPIETRHLKVLTLKNADGQYENVWQSAGKVTANNVKVNQPIPSKLFELMLPPKTTLMRKPEFGGDKIFDEDEDVYKSNIIRGKVAAEVPDFDLLEPKKFEKKVKSGPISESLLEEVNSTLVFN